MRSILLWALMCMACMPAVAAKLEARVPADRREVVERLPRGYVDLMPVNAQADDAAGADGAEGLVLRRAARLLEIASRTGENRLSARADTLLARFPPDSADLQLLRLRAHSAQHRHDFFGALRQLDRLIAIAPRDADARLSRAQIHLVQGRLHLARRDCIALSLGIDAGCGVLCTAALSKRQGHHAAAADLLDRWLQQPGGESGLRVYALRMRAEVAADAGAGDAQLRFERVLALAPDDARTRIAYARYLRTNGRPHEALRLLGGERENDALLLQRALAAKEAGAADAELLAAMIERRFRASRALGASPELRDQAEFSLILRDDAASALALALRQVETQRDEEDLRLLQRAAKAARRLDALRPMQVWAKSQGLSDDFSEPRS
jgi:thioredoxin-like negative regulator of GroEL